MADVVSVETRLEVALGLRRSEVALADHLGQPPVDDQRLAVTPQHDIGRLQVAVQNAAAMGVVDGVADVEEAAEQLPELDAPRRSRVFPGRIRLPARRAS